MRKGHHFHVVVVVGAKLVVLLDARRPLHAIRDLRKVLRVERLSHRLLRHPFKVSSVVDLDLLVGKSLLVYRADLANLTQTILACKKPVNDHRVGTSHINADRVSVVHQSKVIACKVVSAIDARGNIIFITVQHVRDKDVSKGAAKVDTLDPGALNVDKRVNVEGAAPGRLIGSDLRRILRVVWDQEVLPAGKGAKTTQCDVITLHLYSSVFVNRGPLSFICARPLWVLSNVVLRSEWQPVGLTPHLRRLLLWEVVVTPRTAWIRGDLEAAPLKAGQLFSCAVNSIIAAILSRNISHGLRVNGAKVASATSVKELGHLIVSQPVCALEIRHVVSTVPSRIEESLRVVRVGKVHTGTGCCCFFGRKTYGYEERGAVVGR